MRPTARLAIVLAAGALAFPAAARQDRPVNEVPRFRVSVDVVRLDATVTDRNGDVVTDLTAADFQVFQQALGVYAGGTQLSYAYEVYNAGAPVQAAVAVMGGHERVLTVAPDTLVPPEGANAGSPSEAAFVSAKNWGGAAMSCRFQKGRVSTALQQVTFEVR